MMMETMLTKMAVVQTAWSNLIGLVPKIIRSRSVLKQLTMATGWVKQHAMMEMPQAQMVALLLVL